MVDLPWDDLKVVYQPIVELMSEETVGYEALVRGPAGTPLESPDALFSLAGAIGRTTDLDWACVEAAVRGYEGLRRSAPLFVNVAPETLAARDPKTLAKFGCLVTYTPSFPLVVEVSERGFVAGNRLAVERLNLAKTRGLQVAVDDFGTGYSGLLAFTAIRPDYIKVDRSFVAHMDTNPSVRAVIKALVAMARDASAKVVAEGVETPEERDGLIDLGVKLAQGYFFGRPGPVRQVTA